MTKVDIDFTNSCLAETPVYNLATGALESASNSSHQVTSKSSLSFTQGGSYYFPAIPRPGYAPGNTVITLTGGETYTTTHFSGVSPVIGQVYDLGCPSKSPVISVSNPSKLDYNLTSGTFTFEIFNPDGVSSPSVAVTDGDEWLALDSPAITESAGVYTVHFTCSANDAPSAVERTAEITVSYTGAASKPVTITQGINAAESHVWDFATYTDEQMTAITGLAADAKATAGQTWDFGDGLTMVTNSSSKWNKQTISEVNYKWVATGGKYGSGQKYFSFTTAHVGTVTVLYASGGAASRALTVKVGSTETTDSANVSTSTSDLKTVTFSSVAAGTVMLYSKDDNVRVFSISFLED